jgi:acetyl-CoA acetyltransferase
MNKIMPDKIFSAATYCTSGGLICTGLCVFMTGSMDLIELYCACQRCSDRRRHLLHEPIFQTSANQSL